MDAVIIFKTDENGKKAINTDITIRGNKGTAAEIAAKSLCLTFETLDGSEKIDYGETAGCTEITGALHIYYTDFLQKNYIEEVPDAALEPFNVNVEEHAFFEKLVNVIFEDNPEKNKATALYDWVEDNIIGSVEFG